MTTPATPTEVLCQSALFMLPTETLRAVTDVVILTPDRFTALLVGELDARTAKQGRVPA